MEFTPEMEVLYMLFERCHTKNRKRFLKQHVNYLNFRNKAVPPCTAYDHFTLSQFTCDVIGQPFSDELKGILNLPANLVLGLTITFGFIGGLAMIGAGSFFIWRA